MRKRIRNLAEIITKNRDKMRVLQVVQDKINKDKGLKKRWTAQQKKAEGKKSEKVEEKK